jgi:hypothetical protein
MFDLLGYKEKNKEDLGNGEQENERNNRIER